MTLILLVEFEDQGLGDIFLVAFRYMKGVKRVETRLQAYMQNQEPKVGPSLNDNKGKQP